MCVGSNLLHYHSSEQPVRQSLDRILAERKKKETTSFHHHVNRVTLLDSLSDCDDAIYESAPHAKSGIPLFFSPPANKTKEKGQLVMLL